VFFVFVFFFFFCFFLCVFVSLLFFFFFFFFFFFCLSDWVVDPRSALRVQFPGPSSGTLTDRIPARGFRTTLRQRVRVRFGATGFTLDVSRFKKFLRLTVVSWSSPSRSLASTSTMCRRSTRGRRRVRDWVLTGASKRAWGDEGRGACVELALALQDQHDQQEGLRPHQEMGALQRKG